MALYEYRCAGCGPVEVRLAMGAASQREPCPRCGAEARRVYTPPLLGRTPTALSRALGASEASAHEPRVVTGPRPGAPL